ncbi:BTAD domain-containing putative transcriptional regulator [Winogradskya consettensis]|nr:BTAD domain-containing putative transcriptional regulator [Actinoplanes consettensis]
MTFRVLGTVGAVSAGGPVALRGARPRAVLARLLIARGRVVSVDRLVEDLWETPPEAPVAAIRTFVADLRRALEPDRVPRQPASVLVTTPPGYLLRVAPDAVDAWLFERLVTTSAAAGDPGEVLARLEEGLALWAGPPFAEYADRGWARAEIDRLDELRMLAVERRAAALMALGRAAEAVAGLQAQVGERPLREDAWHLLATALYRCGRQGEALGALRQAREVLVTELGVDPGPRLKQLEADVLAQAPHLSGLHRGAASAAPLAEQSGGRADPGRRFVGRRGELGELMAAAGEAETRGRPVLALVGGEAGAGKTALAEALARELAGRGWATVWGRSPEHEGAPVVWPWVRGERLTGGSGPVLLIADDLHRADGDSLDLLTGLLDDPGEGAALVMGTYREHEVGQALGGALARFAKAEPVRVRLGGLSEDETGALVGDVGEQATRTIYRRSGGNPFFARELARLHASGSAMGDVPDGVRDVIRHRLTRLPDGAQDVLRRAAVLGRDVDPEVLGGFAGVDVLDSLDAALGAGFLSESAGAVRFTHILVRDTLYDDLSALRRGRWHADAAGVLEKVRPDDHAALAHHFAHAAGADAVMKAARYARSAAERAEARSNPHEAARLWRQSLAACDRAAPERAGSARAAGDRADGGLGRERLTAVMGLGRALAVIGHLDRTRALRAQAITEAAGMGDRDLLAHVLTAFDVPAIWPRNDDQELSGRIVAAVESALPGAPDALRSRLLSTLALELRGDTGGRGRAAAIEAELLARESGDPALLAPALNARFMHTFEQPGQAPARAAVGAELTALAAAHGLVVFEVLGRLIQLQSACALGDFPAADRHAAAADRLAGDYDLPMVGVFTSLYSALRGDRDVVAYRRACAQLAGAHMPGVADGLLGLILVSVGETPGGGLGPYEPWARPGLLLAAGKRAEAADALRALPESPHDLLWEARLWLAARAAIDLGARDVMAQLYEELLPAAGETAGAQSGILSFGPVDAILDELSRSIRSRA